MEELIRVLPREVREKVDAHSAALTSEELTLRELRRAGGLSPELLGALGRAEVEGDIHLESIGKALRGTGPVIVQGLLNSAPGGGCEFVRFQSQHRLGWVRELAKARVRGACG
jgi:hypothetical protein